MPALDIEDEDEVDDVEIKSVTIRLPKESIYNKFSGESLLGSIIKGFKIISLADVLPKDSDEMYRELTVEL